MSENRPESDSESQYSSSEGSEDDTDGIDEPVFAGEGDETVDEIPEACDNEDDDENGDIQFGLYEPIAEMRGDDGEDLELPRREVDENRLLNTDWCDCGKCELEDSFKAGDCLCCREIPEVAAEADKYQATCITTAEPFEPAILHPISLYIGWLEYTERWRQQARSFGDRNNSKYRYVAYRKLVRWCWGWLGKEIRVQTPACAHSKIMREYPDGRGQYKGTILRPLEVD